MEDNPFKRQMAEAKKRRQEEAEKKAKDNAEKAKAKALAKKKATRAVEDNWLNDGNDEAFASDSDEEGGGMKMIDPLDFFMENEPKPPSEPPKFKVKNLIDFDECNVAEEELEPVAVPTVPHNNIAFSGAGASSSISMAPQLQPSAGASSADHFSGGLFSGDIVQGFNQPMDMHAGNDELLAEIDTLKLMLSSANDEKQIEIEIVTEEKQKIIDDLQRQVSEFAQKPQQVEGLEELHAETISLQEQLERYRSASETSAQASSSGSATAPPLAGSTEPSEEVVELRAELSRANGALAEQQRIACLQETELNQLRRDASAASASSPPRPPPPPPPPSEAAPEVTEVKAETTRLRASLAEWETELDQLKVQKAKLESDLTQSKAKEETLMGSLESQQLELASITASVRPEAQQQLLQAEARIQELTAENQLLEAQVDVAASAVPSSVAALLVEIRALLMSRHENIMDVEAKLVLPAWDAAQTVEDVERQLVDLRTLATRVQADAEAFCERRKEQAGREAAKALREVRVDAERKLSWITKNIRAG